MFKYQNNFMKILYPQKKKWKNNEYCYDNRTAEIYCKSEDKILFKSSAILYQIDQFSKSNNY